jgi:hypothetical protein
VLRFLNNSIFYTNAVQVFASTTLFGFFCVEILAIIDICKNTLAAASHKQPTCATLHDAQ